MMLTQGIDHAILHRLALPVHYLHHHIRTFESFPMNSEPEPAFPENYQLGKFCLKKRLGFGAIVLNHQSIFNIPLAIRLSVAVRRNFG